MNYEVEELVDKMLRIQEMIDELVRMKRDARLTLRQRNRLHTAIGDMQTAKESLDTLREVLS